jgi:hypothetical protein
LARDIFKDTKYNGLKKAIDSKSQELNK